MQGKYLDLGQGLFNPHLLGSKVTELHSTFSFHSSAEQGFKAEDFGLL